MTVKNKMLEAYRAETERHLQASSDFTKRVEQALAEVEKLKAEYEALIHESVATGKDKTAALDKLSEQIEAAEKALERRKAEKAAFNAMRTDSDITKADILNAFNNDVTPEFRVKRFDAVLDRLERAKREYAEAVVDYYAAVKEFDKLREDALDVLGDDFRYKLAQVKLATTDKQARYFLTNRDMYDLQNGDMPASVRGVN